MNELHDEIDILRDVTSKLESVNIQFMLTGSLAMNYYATPRMTRDIDLVVLLKSENIDTIVKIFEDDYYIAKEAIKEAINYSSMFNIIHNKYILKVDFILRKSDEYRKVEFERRKKVKFHDFETYIVSKEDLIISKFFWTKDSQSEMQLKDINNLMQTDYDSEYVINWMKKLNLYELFKDFLND
jgi:hypothetical protein